MSRESLFAHDRNRVVGREVALIIFKHDETLRRDEAVGRAAHGQVDLVVFEGLVEKAQVHLDRSLSKLEPVSTREGGETVLPFQKLSEHAQSKPVRNLHQIGDPAEAKPLAVALSNHQSEVVFVPEGREDGDSESGVVGFQGSEDEGAVGLLRSFEDVHERGPGVFNVDVQ